MQNFRAVKLSVFPPWCQIFRGVILSVVTKWCQFVCGLKLSWCQNVQESMNPIRLSPKLIPTERCSTMLPESTTHLVFLTEKEGCTMFWWLPVGCVCQPGAKFLRPTMAWESNKRTSGATLGQQPGRQRERGTCQESGIWSYCVWAESCA